MLETFRKQLKDKAVTSGAKNLSNARIDAWAAKLDKQNPGLQTDDDHLAKVDAFLELLEMDLKEVAAFDDKKRTPGKQDPTQTPAPTQTSATDPKPAEPNTNDDAPSWFKTWSAAQEQRLAKLETEKTTTSIRQKLAEKLKDVPQSIWGRMVLPEKEEDIESFATSVTQDWVKEGLVKSTKPLATGGNPTGAGKADPDLVNYAKQQNEKAVKKA